MSTNSYVSAIKAVNKYCRDRAIVDPIVKTSFVYHEGNAYLKSELFTRLVDKKWFDANPAQLTNFIEEFRTEIQSASEVYRSDEVIELDVEVKGIFDQFVALSTRAKTLGWFVVLARKDEWRLEPLKEVAKAADEPTDAHGQEADPDEFGGQGAVDTGDENTPVDEAEDKDADDAQGGGEDGEDTA